MPERAALVVIDVQLGLIDGFEEDWAEVLPVIAQQVERARRAGAPIVFVQHNGASPQHPLAPGSPGWALHSGLDVHGEDLRVTKSWSDAFADTDLHAQLRSAGATRVVVVGAQTEFCVDATVRRAASLGYDVDLIADGHTTSGNDLLTRQQIVSHHNTTLPALAYVGVTVRAVPGAELAW